MVVGGRRADRSALRPAEDGDLVFLDPTGGPFQGPGLRRLLDWQDRLDGQRSRGITGLLLIVEGWDSGWWCLSIIHHLGGFEVSTIFVLNIAFYSPLPQFRQIRLNQGSSRSDRYHVNSVDA